MEYKISKPDNKLKGTITLPASKSISNRLLIIQALCKEDFKIHNLSEAQDTQTLKRLLNSGEGELDAGAGGTTMRFLTAYLSAKKGTRILTGTERMKKRPISGLVDALKQLGAEIEYLEKDGYPPLKIQGKPLSGGEVEVNSSISSQFISALLLIAPTLPNGLIIKLKGNIISKPYILMTLKIMEKFGVNGIWKENRITIKNSDYIPENISVEPDWSAASYWYAMAALAEDVDLKLTGLRKESIQGDAIAAQIFNLLGVQTDHLEEGVRLTKSRDMAMEFAFDFMDCPDLAQTVIVVSSLLGISAIYTGLESLRIKETERVAALITELKKLGVDIEELDKGSVKIKQGAEFPAILPAIRSYDDHRMAMSFAPVCLKLGEIKIADPEVVSKSYPGYWDELEKVGFKIEKMED